MADRHQFEFEGEALRIRGLGKDTGVIDSGRAHMQKWVLERLFLGIWQRDSFVVLPNDATLEDARKRFRF